MTTLFDRSDLRPATHVIVVGVGNYQFVDDSSRQKVFEFDLGQLTSPVVSARSITDWLLTHHRNDEVPLGSVELLLSAPDRHYRSPDGAIDKDVEPANLANVRRAWDDWFERCDRDAGNIAIFFFSGHGVSKSHLTLLMDDFGENERRLFENAVDFDASHDAMMTSCRARVQCFFADACRQVPYAVLDREHVEGQVLADRLLAQYMAGDAPRFYATAPTDSAYGLTNKATLYTQAVLQALSGAGSSLSRGRWVVSSGRLQDGIRESVRRLNGDPQLRRQRPMLGGASSGESVLHILPEPPSVPVSVEFDPPDAVTGAQVSFVSLADPNTTRESVFEAGKWRLELFPGDYTGAAVFPNRDYQDYSCRVSTYPPAVTETWPAEAT